MSQGGQRNHLLEFFELGVSGMIENNVGINYSATFY